METAVVIACGLLCGWEAGEAASGESVISFWVFERRLMSSSVECVTVSVRVFF